MKKLLPLIPIMLINTIPIVGVLGLGWNVYRIIYVYWLESLIIGGINLFKMAMANKSSFDSSIGKIVSKIGMMLFFCLHYTIFLFILWLFVFTVIINHQEMNLGGTEFRMMLIMVVAGNVSQLITNYVIPKKYLTTAPSDLFITPYARVGILAAIIFAGRFIAHDSIGNTWFYLMVLVAVKLLADILYFFITSGQRSTQRTR